MRLRSTAKEETELELEVGLLGGLGKKLLRPSGRTPSIFPHKKKPGEGKKNHGRKGKGKENEAQMRGRSIVVPGQRAVSVVSLSLCRKRLKIRGSVQRKKKWEMETAAAASCGKTERVCVGSNFPSSSTFSFFLAACLLMQCKIDAAREKEGRGKKIVQKKTPASSFHKRERKMKTVH